MTRTINGIKRQVVPCRDCGKYLLRTDPIHFVWEVGAVCEDCHTKREADAQLAEWRPSRAALRPEE